ncbi:MAG TPA: aconitate hydratase [Parachlamydiaceae bacterium]|nr:aconitate hydratase [Parachlamydiaceae bacterium]
MADLKNPFNVKKPLKNHTNHYYYSLPDLEAQGFPKISRLPISIRIMLESLLRNCDGMRVKEEDVKRLGNWNAKAVSDLEVPFVVSRVILQDFTGVPLLVDLAAMRDAVLEKGFNSELIEPKVPVDLVVDHSVQVDRSGTEDAFNFNLKVEFQRNGERYSFLKWGQNAFKKFKVVPPGIGIVHQVNLEFLATVISESKRGEETIVHPDTLVGTDSHTTMINGLGVLGWGVGGIEAESAMLDQPVSLQSPEVVGFYLFGKLQEGVTATDLTLRITEILRKEKVVGKFVEFFGEGASSLTVADRATIGNMAPEYGATIGFFPVDEETLAYLKMTGRSDKQIAKIKDYFVAQGFFGIKKKGELDFSSLVELDLNSVKPSVSGPKRPQDRIELFGIKEKFEELLTAAPADGGYAQKKESLYKKICVGSGYHYPLMPAKDSGGTTYLGGKLPLPRSEEEMVANRPIMPSVSESFAEETEKEISYDACDAVLSHGSIVIAAITSCTNTSNPSVMVGAGLLAKKAVEKGLKVNKMIKTSLAPGSRVVTDYLKAANLQGYLNELGFDLVGYGCTTCIGNSGPLDEIVESAIKEHDLVAASVLSGNRNFEARIHSAVKANFLMSPPLVVAFAIAGRVNIDMEKEPLGYGTTGEPIYLKDIWPSDQEISQVIHENLNQEFFKKRYSDFSHENPFWEQIKTSSGKDYAWDKKSTYIQKPPYFDGFSLELPPPQDLSGMRPLAFFGDSVTTDHISPAGAFRETNPAGAYLHSLGVEEKDFNSYGSRRGNHLVMIRGTFANVRIRNQLAEGKEGGYTRLMPDNKLLNIFDACQIYEARKVPLIIFAGKDYGMGSSRDWAAKGPLLLGVKAVVATSFERIHRSNLIGMGILPLQFLETDSLETLNLKGDEIFSIKGLENGLKIREELTLEIEKDGKKQEVKLLCRLDTFIEAEYYRHGGILPYMLRQTPSKAAT